MSKIKAVEISNLEPMIENIIERKLIEILGDPDSGLVLTDKVRIRLEQSFKTKGKGIPADKVANKLGLKW
jgi:hypothetical protein